MTATSCFKRSLALLAICCASIPGAKAAPYTATGSLAADNSVFTYTFTSTSTQNYNFYTTSYGGGMNANGTFTAAGGFVPVLTLFSTTTGAPLGFGGGTAMCQGSAIADPITGLCEDANFSLTLAAGAYTLDLTQFPNVALGNLSAGFLAGTDTSFTGTICGTSGQFLQTDVTPCVQRNSNFALNVTSASPVPEPPSWLFVLPAAAAFAVFGRRQLV